MYFRKKIQKCILLYSKSDTLFLHLYSKLKSNSAPKKVEKYCKIQSQWRHHCNALYCTSDIYRIHRELWAWLKYCDTRKGWQQQECLVIVLNDPPLFAAMDDWLLFLNVFNTFVKKVHFLVLTFLHFIHYFLNTFSYTLMCKIHCIHECKRYIT